MLSRSTLLHDALTARGVISVLTVVFLVGCAGTPGPQTTGGTSPPTAATTPAASAKASSTPVTSPSPSAVYRPASAHGPAENVPLPKLPKLAKQKSKEGLIAFAEYWYKTVEYAHETGDVSLIREISGPQCFACNKTYDRMTQGFAEGDWLAGGKFDIRAIESEFVETGDGRYQLLVRLSQREVISYGPKDTIYAVVDEGPPGVQIMEATYTTGRWTAENVETINQ